MPLTARSTRPRLPLFAWVMLLHGGVAAAQTATQGGEQNSQGRDEVVISALKMDLRTLDRVTIPRFVQARGIATPRIEQLARWNVAVCPATQGLQPAYAEMFSRRILSLARSVGAPTIAAGSCNANVEIVFTTSPQQQLDAIVKSEPGVLGFPSAADARGAAVTRPIQAWYVTGTRSQATVTARTNGIPTPEHGTGQSIFVTVPTHSAPQPAGGVQIDSQDWGGAGGRAGSRLGVGLTSEFVHVLVLIDSTRLNQHSLSTIADYVGMLALTRTSLDGCAELPSIIDILSPDCGPGPRPDSMTVADLAFLKALYSASLERNLNVSQGEIHDRMLRLMVDR